MKLSFAFNWMSGLKCAKRSNSWSSSFQRRTNWRHHHEVRQKRKKDEKRQNEFKLNDETATRLHRLLKILNILMCLIYWTFCMLKRCSSVQQGDLIVALMSSSQPWQSLSSAWGFLKCNSLLRSLDDSHIRLIFFSQTQTREKSNEHLAFTGSDNEVSFTTLRLNTPAQWDQNPVTCCDNMWHKRILTCFKKSYMKCCEPFRIISEFRFVLSNQLEQLLHHLTKRHQTTWDDSVEDFHLKKNEEKHIEKHFKKRKKVEDLPEDQSSHLRENLWQLATPANTKRIFEQVCPGPKWTQMGSKWDPNDANHSTLILINVLGELQWNLWAGLRLRIFNVTSLESGWVRLKKFALNFALEDVGCLRMHNEHVQIASKCFAWR